MAKIFQIIRSIHLGGAEIVAFNLSECCRSNSPDEFEFVVVELHQSHDDYSVEKKKQLESKGIRIISAGTSSKNVSLLIGPFVLAYHVLKEKPDIIHSHTDLPDLLLSGTKRIFSLFGLKFPKIVRTIHNTELWSEHAKLGKFTEEAFQNDFIVGVSDGSLNAYNNLRKKYGIPASSFQQVIYNGCVIPGKQPHPFKIDSSKINIAYCGRFVEQKGIDILIDRIAEIQQKFPETFLFHVIGTGPYQDGINKLAEKTANVLVYQAVPNISEKLYAFDFIIMPSRFEGLSLMSIEASFSKVPVIAAYAPGLTETLPPHWALLFKLESADELIAIFRKIKDKAFDLQALGNETYQFVSEDFSHSRMIDEYSKLYSTLTE